MSNRHEPALRPGAGRTALRLLAGLVAVVAALRVCGAGENLFAAGTFEQRNASGLPVGWKRMPDQKRLAGTLGEFTVVDEGTNHYIRFRDNAPSIAEKSTAGLFLDGYLPLKPEWKQLTISMRLRALVTGLGTQSWNAAQMIVDFHGADGQTIHPTNRLPRVRDMCPWTTFSMTVDVPPGATNLWLKPGLWGCTGYACFDDITVTVP